MHRGIRVRSASRSSSRGFLVKARECYQGMKDEIEAKRYNSSTILAVHAVISACDALTSFYLQQRSASDRHLDVLSLIGRLPFDKSKLDAKSKQIARVIDVKNAAEYEERSISAREAEDAARDAERTLNWAIEKLPELK